MSRKCYESHGHTASSCHLTTGMSTDSRHFTELVDIWMPKNKSEWWLNKGSNRMVNWISHKSTSTFLIWKLFFFFKTSYLNSLDTNWLQTYKINVFIGNSGFCYKLSYFNVNLTDNFFNCPRCYVVIWSVYGLKIPNDPKIIDYLNTKRLTAFLRLLMTKWHEIVVREKIWTKNDNDEHKSKIHHGPWKLLRSFNCILMYVLCYFCNFAWISIFRHRNRNGCCLLAER